MKLNPLANNGTKIVFFENICENSDKGVGGGGTFFPPPAQEWDVFKAEFYFVSMALL